MNNIKTLVILSLSSTLMLNGSEQACPSVAVLTRPYKRYADQLQKENNKDAKELLAALEEKLAKLPASVQFQFANLTSREDLLSCTNKLKNPNMQKVLGKEAPRIDIGTGLIGLGARIGNFAVVERSQKSHETYAKWTIGLCMALEGNRGIPVFQVEDGIQKHTHNYQMLSDNYQNIPALMDYLYTNPNEDTITKIETVQTFIAQNKATAVLSSTDETVSVG